MPEYLSNNHNDKYLVAYFFICGVAFHLGMKLVNITVPDLVPPGS